MKAPMGLDGGSVFGKWVGASGGSPGKEITDPQHERLASGNIIVLLQQPSPEQGHRVEIQMRSKRPVSIRRAIIQFGGAIQEEQPRLLIQFEKYIQLRPEL